MFGVVLWTDIKDRKAVIWCEDHGDLAFCNNSMDGEGCVLDTGDLIQFDVTVDRHMRLAENPQKVSEGAFQGLADTLRSMPADGPVPVPATTSPQHGAEVIPFSRNRPGSGASFGSRSRCAAS